MLGLSGIKNVRGNENKAAYYHYVVPIFRQGTEERHNRF